MKFFLVAVFLAHLSPALLGADAPTYCRDIAPLINNNCVACHRPGEVAPFSLLTYKDVRKRGKLIAEVVQSRTMPPWKAVPNYGEFVGARRLTDEQIKLVRSWVRAGMPEGNQKDLPEPPTFSSGWRLGTPDIVVTMPEPYQLPPEGADVYRNFILPLEIPEGKYIRAIEYQPENRRIVHHAVLSMDTNRSLRKKDEADPGMGFSTASVQGKMLPGTLALWTPGWEPVALPKEFSLPWPKGTDLVMQLHFHLSGKPESEQSNIGIYLTDTPPSKTMMDLLLETRKIDIPAGEKNYRTRDFFFLPVEVDIFGLFPHMHWLGKDVKLIAKMPGGEEKILLWINDWDFKWQGYYQYTKPIRVPAGTELIMECVHDNSSDNPNNPSTPPKRVRWGEQTFNEMSDIVVQILPVNESDTMRIRTSLGLRVIGGIWPKPNPR